MAEFGEWTRKGPVLSDVTAQKADLKKKLAALEARKATLGNAVKKISVGHNPDLREKAYSV
jgi:cell division protein FtsB